MDVADGIVGYIREEVLIDPDQTIEIDTPLLNGLLDSSDLLRLATFVEETFGTPIEPADMSEENLATVRHLERFVTSQLTPT